MVRFADRLKRRKRARGEGGFTLIEILVVIAIIALIMSLVGPRVLNYLGESKVKAAKIQIQSFGSALDLFNLDTGRYPSTSEGLTVLVQSTGSIPSWNGPYLKGGVLPNDPWVSHMSIVRQASTAPMILSPMAPMVRKAGLERPPISPVGAGERSASEGGFTLIEVVCVLAIIALLAAILLPEIPRGTSRSRLQAYALEIATLLKSDRNAAIRQRAATATEIDAIGRSVRSGASARTVRVPADVQFDAALASRCNQREAGSMIVFFASGMSCGGVIALTRLGVGYQIRVNWLTGGVEIVPLNAL